MNNAPSKPNMPIMSPDIAIPFPGLFWANEIIASRIAVIDIALIQLWKNIKKKMDRILIPLMLLLALPHLWNYFCNHIDSQHNMDYPDYMDYNTDCLYFDYYIGCINFSYSADYKNYTNCMDSSHFVDCNNYMNCMGYLCFVIR